MLHSVMKCTQQGSFCEVYSYKGPINNIPALVQKMAWRRLGDKSLSEQMMISFLTHICVTWPQWVNQSLTIVLFLRNPMYTQPFHSMGLIVVGHICHFTENFSCRQRRHPVSSWKTTENVRQMIMEVTGEAVTASQITGKWTFCSTACLS